MIARTLLCSALALGLGFPTAADADLRLSTSGLGDALYIPYYTVEGGQTSLLTVANAGSQATAVQVLLAESLNGQNVLSFSVYLAPHSVWSAAITADGERAKLVSESDVCTLPVRGPLGFRAVNFDYAFNHPDAGSTSLTRTRTGAIEVIELGQLSGELAAAAVAGDCIAIQTAFTISNGVSPDLGDQYSAPGGNISANLQVIKVVDGVVFSVPAIALRGFSDVPLYGVGFDHYPRLANPILPGGAEHYTVDYAGQRLRFESQRGPDAVSALFSSAQLGGEFYATPALGAQSRWVVSFPTKHVYVHQRAGSLVSGGEAVSPFSTAFSAEGACETIATRPGRLDGQPLEVGGQPIVDSDRTLCGQVNLLDFPAGEVDAGTELLRFSADPSRVILATREDGTPVQLQGLPAVGLQLSTFINGQAQPGILANYSVSVPLRAVPSPVLD